jgi:hypothetical protein
VDEKTDWIVAVVGNHFYIDCSAGSFTLRCAGMRQLLRPIEGLAIATVAVIGFVKVFGDLDWIKRFLSEHQKTSNFLHSAWILPIITLCIIAVYFAQQQLNRPSLRATILSIQVIPRVWDLPLNEAFAATARNPIDYDILAELQVVNESDPSVTIGDFDGTLIINKKEISMTYVARMFDYVMHTTQTADGERNVSSNLSSLMDQVKDKALAKGIAYRGWVRFEAKQLEHIDGQKLRIKIWVLDTLGGKHSVKQDKRKPLNEANQIMPVLNR